jgi:hypothetical protein
MGMLPAARKERLDELEFDWDPLESAWDDMFTGLERYKERFGHCGRLSAEQKTQLDELGFDWEPLESAWKSMFAELKRYKEEHGHCNVPRRLKENPRLPSWVNRQRALNRGRRQPPSHKACLAELGFVWEPHDATWESMFTALKRYKERFGHCNVARGWMENPKLATWVLKQRQKQDSGRLSTDQQTRLDALGFDWDPLESAWDDMFTGLERYKERFGHCNVPRGWIENPALATWVLTQRQRHGGRRLSAEQRARLDALGFDWNPLEATWDNMLTELECFKERFGHCNVPRGWIENPRLEKWVSRQRSLQTAGRLSPSRKARLDKLEFDWDPRDSVWESMFMELKRYKERFDHCNVPTRWTENPELGTWVATQRQRQERLLPERKERLDALEFKWALRKRKRNAITRG